MTNTFIPNMAQDAFESENAQVVNPLLPGNRELASAQSALEPHDPTHKR